MEFNYYSPSGTFVVLTADQFVGREEMCQFFGKRGYPASVVQAGHHQSSPLRSLIILLVPQPMSSTCTSTNVIYCITCNLCKKLYIGETGR